MKTKVNATNQRLKISYGGSTRGILGVTKDDIVRLEKLWKVSYGVMLSQEAELNSTVSCTTTSVV